MQTLTESLIEQGLKDRILSERQLERIVGDSPARRYGLVNRALKASELIQVRRGLYVLAPKLRTYSPHPFTLAQAIEPGSYVSLETALSYHGWIPESVRVTASIVPGRKSSRLDHPVLGSFTFHPLALHRTHFLELVEREQFGQTALVASPLRALMDLVTFRKVEWSGLTWLTESLRIERENLKSISREQIHPLATLYKQKRSNHFLAELAKALDLD
jgi:hypothetical protein